MKIFKNILISVLILLSINLFIKFLPGLVKQPRDFYLSKNYLELDDLFSKNAIVVNRSTGEIIMGKNYNNRINPASMTKVMTNLVAIENLKNLNKKALVSQETIDYCLSEGMSLSGFNPGDEPKILDLLYASLLESGGEASISLAKYVAGTEQAFVDLMNEKAKKLGMSNTHFSNSTGITSSENYSSPEDIAILYNYALNNRTFKKIVGSKSYTPKGFSSNHKIQNNLFMKRAILNINKDFIRTGKTGYTEAAGLCLVSNGQVNNTEYIVVVANAKGNPHTEQYNLIDTNYIYTILNNKNSS